MRRLAVLVVTAAASLLAAAAAPPAALAHGLSGRADLPIPVWLFTWAAAAVLVISFLALAVLWPRPRLQDPPFRPLPKALSRVLTSRMTEVVCGAIGLAGLGVVLWAGLFGSEIISENLAPTFIYVGFWLGLVPLSLLFGDVFRAFNPWRAGGRLVGFLLRHKAPEPLPYPRRLGYWPAALGLFAFVWLEVVSSSGNEPQTLAAATFVYSTVTWFGMALYGVEAWSRRGDAFGVYFGLFARMSAFERRGDEVGLRPPLSGLPQVPMDVGLVALVSVMIGTVTFDGLSAGPSFQDFLSPVLGWLEDAGLEPQFRLELVYALSLVVTIALVYGVYRLGVAGAHALDRRHGTRTLARNFAHTLVPIALAYAAAHYVSLLLFQGQALAPLASDPLGRGWNLFGTADWGIDYGFLSAEAFWYLQLFFVLAGHLAGLALAHDRALVIYDDGRVATRSQYWMLGVMVGFTTLALWLLSEASKG